MYKQLVAEYMRKNSRLEQENTKLRIALCNLRDEYLDMGGDPNQLELFDKDDVSQLKLDFEVTDDVYKDKNTGDYYNIVGEQLGDYGSD